MEMLRRPDEPWRGKRLDLFGQLEQLCSMPYARSMGGQPEMLTAGNASLPKGAASVELDA